MRRVFCALMMSGLAAVTLAAFGAQSPARAADYVFPIPPIPVAPATFTRWSGFYFGGQGSFGETNANFSGATAPLVDFSLRDTTLEAEQSPSQYPVLGSATNNAFGFGGFVGYNVQFQDVVVGIEGNYTRTSFNVTASNTPISRATSAGGSTYDVNITGTGNLQLTDYGSLRARAGFIIGSVMPYGFAGVVVGHGSYSITSLVSGQENPSTPPTVPCNYTLSPSCVDFSYANSAGSSNALLYGLSAGGGVDWALTPNFFLRGEFEYTQFASYENINVYIVSAHLGAGFKF